MSRKYPEVVAVDFDETIGLFNPKAKKVSGYKVKSVTNVPNPRIVELIKKLRASGVRIVVYTSRWWGDYNSLVEWFDKHKIKVDDIICGRFKADLYLCDKSLNAHIHDLEVQTDRFLKETNNWGCHYDKYYKKDGKN